MNQETGPGRKKVLFVVTKSNFGGAQKYVFDLATNLPKDAFEPVVLAGPAQGSALAGELLTRLSQAGVRTIFVPQMHRDVSLTDWSTFRALMKAFRSERPDIVHLNSSKAGGLGALAARLCRVPRIVFTVHGWPFRESRNPLAKLLIYKASAATVMLSHRVVCISQFDADVFRRFPLLAKKIALIRTGIQEASTPQPKLEARRALVGNAHEADIWIGSIGELNFNKNIKTALDAMVLALKSEPRLFYVVIGSGEQAEKLALYAKKRGLEGRIHFSGQIPHASRLLSAFDVFLLPSRKEGLPYVLLEAALAHVPVVASSVGGIPELIENGVSGALCDPSDTMGIADAVVELASDQNLRERFSNALLQKVVVDYALERMLRDTVALYKR